MSATGINLLLAALTILLAIIATLIGFRTLQYMRSRDAEVDTRNAWVEVHKAMINLRVEWTFVMAQLGKIGRYPQGATGPSDVGVREYTLARAQLRGQLDRVNEADPLIIGLANFLDENLMTAKWQTTQYQTAFDGFVHQVAAKTLLAKQ
jgi:hypothetical protein